MVKNKQAFSGFIAKHEYAFSGFMAKYKLASTRYLLLFDLLIILSIEIKKLYIYKETISLLRHQLVACRYIKKFSLHYKYIIDYNKNTFFLFEFFFHYIFFVDQDFNESDTGCGSITRGATLPIETHPVLLMTR